MELPGAQFSGLEAPSSPFRGYAWVGRGALRQAAKRRKSAAHGASRGKGMQRKTSSQGAKETCLTPPAMLFFTWSSAPRTASRSLLHSFAALRLAAILRSEV